MIANLLTIIIRKNITKMCGKEKANENESNCTQANLELSTAHFDNLNNNNTKNSNNTNNWNTKLGQTLKISVLGNDFVLFCFV